MKTIFSFVFVLLMIACNNAAKQAATSDKDSISAKVEVHNTLTNAQKKDGWQLLFDGKSTAGWHNWGYKPVGAAWKIKENALVLDVSNKQNGRVVGGGHILSDEEFENFHLKFDWKISQNGNSGVVFLAKEDTTKYKIAYETGPEMQVLDNDGHPDGKIIKHRAGDLYDLISCSKETVKPVGEWNQAEIKLVNGKLDFYLNGENVVSTMMWDDNWKQMVAGSKFKNWKDFATYKKGRICLTDHDDEVSYRNIMIKKL